MFWFNLTHNRTHLRPIKLIRDPMGIYIVAKFGTDWSIFADATVLTKSNMANFLIQGEITQTVLVKLVPLYNSFEILWSFTF